eukprot:2970742-Pleurochrysis_carterae.AAC.2
MPRLSFARCIADTCDAFHNVHPGLTEFVEAARVGNFVVSMSSSMVPRSSTQDKSNIFGDPKRVRVDSSLAIGTIC